MLTLIGLIVALPQFLLSAMYSLLVFPLNWLVMYKALTVNAFVRSGSWFVAGFVSFWLFVMLLDFSLICGNAWDIFRTYNQSSMTPSELEVICNKPVLRFVLYSPKVNLTK